MIEKQSVTTRLKRKLWSLLPPRLLRWPHVWPLLRAYPTLVPRHALFQRWNRSPWQEYQQWLTQHGLQTPQAWHALRARATAWRNPPRISVITPVHNTPDEILYECILSVRAQAYPYWQWVIVDDASQRAETRALLASGVCREPRIKRLYSEQPLGIAAASNRAIAEADGDYVLFLDHDDRLSLDALFYLAEAIERGHYPDIVYGDRDMISPDGERYMHLFKPDWSPENLLAGNYVFHPMCYRREFLQRLGGLRPEYDGSQDYDLVLRAVEAHARVVHVPKVLYHWRQHTQSVSYTADAKAFAFEAGLRALNASLQRRGINAQAEEIGDLWRGNYRLVFEPVPRAALTVIILPTALPLDDYARFITEQLHDAASAPPYLALIAEGLTKSQHWHDVVRQLAAWLQCENVSFASGKIVLTHGMLDYIGMAYRRDGGLIQPYRGFPAHEPGYMAITRIAHNVSAPHPFFVVLRREPWARYHGFDPNYKGPHALLDLALQAQRDGQRCVVDPQFTLTATERFAPLLLDSDQHYFTSKWAHRFAAGDPYYNANLDEHSDFMAINYLDQRSL